MFCTALCVYLLPFTNCVGCQKAPEPTMWMRRTPSWVCPEERPSLAFGRVTRCAPVHESVCSVEKERATGALMCGGAQDAALRNYHLYVELGSNTSIECARLMHRWLRASVLSKQLSTCASSYPLFLYPATLAAVRLPLEGAGDWGC